VAGLFGALVWGAFVLGGFYASWMWAVGAMFAVGYVCLLGWIDNSGSEDDRRERWLREHPE
jgi:hypothetical protein